MIAACMQTEHNVNESLDKVGWGEGCVGYAQVFRKWRKVVRQGFHKSESAYRKSPYITGIG